MIFTAIEIAKKADARIIVLTDKLTAPMTKHSDVVLLSEVDSATIKMCIRDRKRLTQN